MSGLIDLASLDDAALAAIGSGQSLTRTAVKTGAYTAAAGDIIPVDTTAGSVTVTLPTAPADKAKVAVKHIIRGGTNAVTVACGGSDVLNKTGGNTTATLTLVNQGATYEYQASTHIWTVTGSDLPLSQIDARYDAAGAATAVQAASLQKTTQRKSLPAPFVGAYGGIGLTLGTAGSAGGYTARWLHTVPVAVTEVRIVVPIGFVLPTGGESLNTNVVPIFAAIESGSTTYPLTFNGQQSVTVGPGGLAVSDPVPLEVAAGGTFWTRVYAGMAQTEKWVEGVPAVGPGVATTGNGYTTGSNVVTATGALTTGGNLALWTPTIIGTPASGSVVSLGFLGDSITAGTGDTSAGSIYGWSARGTNGTVPHTRVAVGNLQMQTVRSSFRRSLPYLANATHVVLFIGTNDLANGGRSFAQLQSDTTWAINYFTARGCKVYGATMLPRTTSTDSWATTGNQTPVTSMAAGTSSNRGLYNAWVRSSAGGLLAGYVELADIVESSRDSGVWTVGYTTDGIHPNTAAHTLMGAALAALIPTLTAA